MKRIDDAITGLRIKNLKGITKDEMDAELYNLSIIVFKIMDEQQVKAADSVGDVVKIERLVCVNCCEVEVRNEGDWCDKCSNDGF